MYVVIQSVTFKLMLRCLRLRSTVTARGFLGSGNETCTPSKPLEVVKECCRSRCRICCWSAVVLISQEACCSTPCNRWVAWNPDELDCQTSEVSTKTRQTNSHISSVSRIEWPNERFKGFSDGESRLQLLHTHRIYGNTKKHWLRSAIVWWHSSPYR
ncbi:hypothetical protein K439DRAFT_1116657 [Ramaria rubella]|nr:hypothetical protein K439DRAFT_1116657 [Ramaria rubella]